LKHYSDCIFSREDFAHYGLAIQHVFTRIARDLLIFNIPKYKNSDFIFDNFSFRFMNIKWSKRQLIVDFLSKFSEEEINAV